ncbi:MAG: hypothetical protein GXO96_01190 [Nitrospirae bacterium]|nr:hypothetical protein [Candidatus Manganitrophaceae bacterium]
MKVSMMRRSIGFFFCTCFLLLSGGCQTKETPLPGHRGGQLYQGKVRMDINCHGCHGWLGEGSIHAPALATDGRSISYFKFYSAVTFGRGDGMPAYQRVFSEKDIKLIIDWLQLVSVLRSVK